MACQHSFKTPIQRLYEELKQPVPPKPAPSIPKPVPRVSLDAADVADILKYKRRGTPEELQFVIDNAKQFRLSAKQKNEIAVQLTIAVAGRDLPPVNPNAELFEILDVVETKYGLLHHRSWFDNELKRGAQQIVRCKNHKPPRCECWRSTRERLWLVQSRYGPRSPEEFTATRLYEALEELEQSARPTLNLPPVQVLVPQEDDR